MADLTVPLGFWRSVGNSMNAFFLESFLDEMAQAAQADPLAFRLELMRDTHPPSALLMEKVRDMSGWDGLKRPGFGRGVAFCYSFGTPVAQVMEVQQTEGGIRMTRAWIACDPGLAMDPGIVEAQMTGGAIYGLSAAVQGAITFADQQVVEQNFPITTGCGWRASPPSRSRSCRTTAPSAISAGRASRARRPRRLRWPMRSSI